MDAPAFTLDTSGKVIVNQTRIMWSDVDPFTQGYGKAAAQELYERLIREGWTHEAASEAVAFRNWAPETLAAILKDRAAFNARIGDAGHNRGIGAKFWESRQIGFSKFWSLHQADLRAAFPPLTPEVRDDGRVYLREAA